MRLMMRGVGEFCCFLWVFWVGGVGLGDTMVSATEVPQPGPRPKVCFFLVTAAHPTLRRAPTPHP